MKSKNKKNYDKNQIINYRNQAKIEKRKKVINS